MTNPRVEGIIIKKGDECLKKLKYGVKGMSCAACVAHVEAAAKKVCGEQSVSVSLLTNTVTVIAEDNTDETKLFSELKASLRSAGYTLVADGKDRENIEKAEQKKNTARLIVSLALTAILMYVAMGHMMGLPVPNFLHLPALSATVQMIIAFFVMILFKAVAR